MDLEIPDVDRRILSRTGMNVESSWAKIAGKQMAMDIAHKIYMGHTETEMVGLFAKAASTSTYDTVKWNAVKGPHSTVGDMIWTSSNIWSHGFRPPYVCILSDNLKYGWSIPIASTPVTDITNGDMALNMLNGNKSGDTSNLFWEDIGTNAQDGQWIYPIETATSNDGRAIIMKPVQDGVHYVEGVWCQRPHTTEWDFDAKTDMWHTRIKAMITLQVYDADAIVDHTSVNLA